ncbi:MAG: diaminopimelate epimerase [Gemmatimonadetes bacterium]|nr:diaminopimelate epimerase [Gemmatimonadota bacterium]
MAAIRSTGHSAPSRASAQFFKGEALGNDYLVFESGDAWPVTPAGIRLVCDRHRGVGADGLVLVRSRSQPVADYAVRIFNPDGSEAERSGNGLRIFAVACASGDVRSGTAGASRQEFRVEVGGGMVRVCLHGRTADDAWDVSVEMGRASFEERDAGFDRTRFESGARLEELTATTLRPVSVGNPHLVVFGDLWDGTLLLRLGPPLSTHPAFARGANVQLATWPAGRRIRALVWERGAGETSASGTSACAVAAAAVREGLLEPGTVYVEMPGGTLEVDVDADFSLTLRGPARAVCRGELSPGLLEAVQRNASQRPAL